MTVPFLQMHVMLQHLHLTAENMPSKARYTDKAGDKRSLRDIHSRDASREYSKKGAGLALSMTQRVTDPNNSNQERSKFVTLVYYKGEKDFVSGRQVQMGSSRFMRQRSTSA